MKDSGSFDLGSNPGGVTNISLTIKLLGLYFYGERFLRFKYCFNKITPETQKIPVGLYFFDKPTI